MVKRGSIVVGVVCATFALACSKGGDDNKAAGNAPTTNTPQSADPKTRPAPKPLTAVDAGIKKAPAKPAPIVLEPGKDLYGDLLAAGTHLRMGTTRLRHMGAVNAIAVSPDGSVVVSCGFGDDAIWDIETGKRLRSFDGCGSDIYFNADGTKLIMTYQDSVKIIDYVTAKPQRTLKLHDKFIKYIAVSKDRSKVLTAASDKTSKLVDLTTGKPLQQFKGSGWLRSIALSPDGAWAALHFDKFQVYNTKTGKPLAVKLGRGQRSDAYQFSPNSKELAVAAWKSIQVWDLSLAKVVRQFAMPRSVAALAYSPDGTMLAAAGGHSIFLIDAVTGKTKHMIKRPSNHGGKLVFTPDGKKLVAIASLDNAVRIIDVAAGKELQLRPAHAANVNGLAFFADAKAMISADRSGSVRKWNGTNGVQLAEWRPNSDSNVLTMASSVDGRYLAFSGGDRIVQVWDAKLGKAHKSLTADTGGAWGRVQAVAITPDAKVVAALIRERVVVWDVATGKQRVSWKVPSATNYIVVAPGGDLVATTVRAWGKSAANEITIWDARKGAPARTIKGHAKDVAKLVFMPDGRLVSLSSDNTVKFWDAKTGKELQKMSRRSPRDIAVSGDGKRIAIADGWGKVEVWEPAGPTLIHTMKLHIWFKAIALSFDGKTLASADSTNDVVLWKLPK